MKLLFRESDHKYYCPENPEIKFLGVTTFIKKFSNPFDDIKESEKSSKNKKSKWFGLTPEEIRIKWKGVNTRAIELGKKYHLQQELEALEKDTIIRKTKTLTISKPTYNSIGDKEAPDQKLLNNVLYPEHFVYLKSSLLCGQADVVEVIDKKLYISDYKTNKSIDITAFREWNSSTNSSTPKMMLGPLAHLEDCNFTHYSLQMSIYAYMILKTNFMLELGDMTLKHIKFEEEGRDEYDYPIHKLDSLGNPIVKEVIEYKCPYLKKEVLSMIDYLKQQNEPLKMAA